MPPVGKTRSILTSVFERHVRGRTLTFIVEDNHPGCAHACTVDDVCRVMANIPSDDGRGLRTFVLRQPTRKQRILNPVWGRLYYHADLRRRSGSAVVLEATACEYSFGWSSSLRPSDQDELDRLRADGHQVRQDGRRYIVSSTLASVRATQLYRTLLHEVGHWVDFLEKVVTPSDSGLGERSALWKAFFARARDEGESFAHQYADRMGARLVKFGIIPFEQDGCGLLGGGGGTV